LTQPLEHRALKPKPDELVVRGAARGLRLDQPEPVTGGKRLVQQPGALDPGQRAEVIAAEFEQIDDNEVQLARRRAVPLQRGLADRREVLDDSAVARAERNELSIED
jgi:hypothetical protein